MIAFFRSILESKLVMGLFALIMLAFVITGVGTGSGGIGNLAAGSSQIAKIGSDSIDPTEAARNVQAQFDAARQQQPGFTLADYMSKGGVDQVINSMIDSRSLNAFGKLHGMVASDRLVDSEIAEVAAFKGLTGQFDRDVFLSFLGQRKLTETGVREDIGRSKIASMLIIPAGGSARVPMGVISPYASLLLEAREGQIAAIPTAATAAGPEPTDAELKTFYTANLARYTAPETRTFRYALFDRTRFAGQGQASEAEIAKAYATKSADYAGKQTRVITQLVVTDQKAAEAMVAKIKAGTAIAAAAKAVGNEATTLATQDQTGFASLSTAAVAKAAFAAKQGDTLVAGKSGLGWHVVHIDKVTDIAGKTLADMRGTLSAEIGKGKVEQLMSDFVTTLDEEVSGGASFDDVIKKYALTAVATPLITAAGIAPADKAYKLPAELSIVLHDAFQAEPDDDAAVLSLAQGQTFAFYDLDKVSPAAPRPLASIGSEIAADFKADRAFRNGRKLAESIATKVRGGMPLAQAISSAGVPLPALRPMNAKRIDLAQMEGKVPAPLALLFSMSSGGIKTLEAPQKQGWYVISLTKIIPGDAASRPDLVAAAQQQIGRSMGDEYISQFANAIKASLGVTRNANAIATLKKGLTSNSSQ